MRRWTTPWLLASSRPSQHCCTTIMETQVFTCTLPKRHPAQAAAGYLRVSGMANVAELLQPTDDAKAMNNSKVRVLGC